MVPARIAGSGCWAGTSRPGLPAALAPLGVSPPQLLELAAVLGPAGLLLGLLDQLLALWAAGEVLDELGDRCHWSSFGWVVLGSSAEGLSALPGRSHRAQGRDDGGPHAGYSPSRAPPYLVRPQSGISHRTDRTEPEAA